jgi:hypothetical protein
MTIQTINPAASSHDAWESGAGAVTLTDEVKVTAGTAWAGLFAPSVTATKVATIISATLYYQSSASTHDEPDFNWYAQAADTASVFTTGSTNISSRTRTTAVTQDTATGIGNSTYRSVDVTAQVAEVVSRTGWASGNNLALLGDARSGSCDLWMRSYDSGGAVWYLEINYTEPPAGDGQPTVARLRLVPGVGKTHGQQGW